MKRSEMIKIINAVIILDDGFNSSNGLAPVDDPELPEKILRMIENAGMLPPLNEETYHFMDNDSRKEIYAGKQYFTWEEEDETK